MDWKFLSNRRVPKTRRRDIHGDFGDGGGDSHVRLGGLDYVEVNDYRDLEDKLSFLFE